MSIWAEAWTRPGDPVFGRLIDDLPFTEYGLHDGVNQLGDGNGTLPDTYERFDELLLLNQSTPANSVRSLIRYFDDSDPTEPFFEWLPSMILPSQSKESRTVRVSGRSIKSVLGEARLEAFDWDGSDDHTPQDADWQWGGNAQNLVRNPGFEQETFPNGGGEDGNAGHWASTDDDTLFNPASVSAINSAADARSGDWYILVDPTGQMSGVRRSINGLIVGESYTITGFLRESTASGDRYRAGVEGAVSASHANAYEEDGIVWAELGNVAQPNGASDGTWQSFTITFVAAEDQVALFVVYQDVNDFAFQLDDWTITGDNVGIDPWSAFSSSRRASTVDGLVSTLNFARVTGAQAHSGSNSLEFQGRDGPYYDAFGRIGYGTIGIAQALPRLTVGKTYTAEVWVRHDGAGTERLRLVLARITPKGALRTTIFGTRIPGPGSYYMTSLDELVSPNTWTRIRITFVPDVSEMSIQVRYAGSNSRNVDVGTFVSPTVFVDDVAVYEGLPATTLGDILGDIYDHATDPGLRDPIVWDDGAGTDTPYLTLDFDDSTDSGGLPWWEDEISVKLYMRMRYDQILDQFVRSAGYEWRVVPNSVANGTWKLQVYNPGTMKVDHTAGTLAIQGGSSDTRRSIRRHLPDGTDFLVEGLGRATARDRNTGLMTALGRIEASRLDRELPSLDAVIAAVFEDATDALVSSESYGYVLTDPPSKPLIDYSLGDLLVVHDPPEVDADSRFVDVTASFTPESEEWDTEFVPATGAGS